jgi:D-alanyl-D-alanine carboxypeptidase (penicillin-binding protein 5/6)
MNLIAVALGCDTGTERFKCASTMLDYGFNNYGVIVPEKVKLDTIKVNKGMEGQVALKADEPETVITEKTNTEEIETIVKISDSIDAPVKANTVVGKIIYKLKGKTIQQVDVKTKEDVEECSFGNSFRYLWGKLISL